MYSIVQSRRSRDPRVCIPNQEVSTVKPKKAVEQKSRVGLNGPPQPGDEDPAIAERTHRTNAQRIRARQHAITSEYVTRPNAKRINDVLRTRPLEYRHRPSDREDRIEIRPNEDPRRPEHLPEASTTLFPSQIRPIRIRTDSTRRPTRSEEHTSELQSRLHL